MMSGSGDSDESEPVGAAPDSPGSSPGAAKLADLLAAAAAEGCGPAIERHADLLSLLARHSPYLWRLARADIGRLAKSLNEDPQIRMEGLVDAVAVACNAADAVADVMRILREAKQEMALLVALADLRGHWHVTQVTGWLSRFADVAVAAALRFLLREAAGAGKLTGGGDDGCGMVVLALGKHGACELNYSSDIDLVVFFDPNVNSLRQDIVASTFYVRTTKSLVRLLQERTAEGYVFRVDLRLRPDPASTAIAIGLPAAYSYYESVGQNWERAAWIKARPVAGDLVLGRRFIESLAPFIWRKYFDYAAIADIHAMKRQIHAVRGHATVTVAGHDLKLGRGGIREIEFFVQTQQLIFGGRRPQLRGSRTLDMLIELERDGWITGAARDELSTAYCFLRTLEHRLQMIADEQTQRLPSDAAELEGFARLCGFDGRRAFEDELVGHLLRVEAHYARLFENAPGLHGVAGNLVFTGTADDPGTLETLRQLHFKDPARAAETVRGWHFGRRPAVQSARAREVLTELVPGLLAAFSGSGDPDAALNAFDGALSRMPAAVELFSLLRSNAALRELFADILGAAPRLARVVTNRPHVLDAAIDPALMGAAPDDDRLAARIVRSLAQANGTEAFLDRSRDIKYEEQFLIGLRLLTRAVAADAAARAYTTLAETLLAATLARVEDDFAADAGRIPGGRSVLVALGKLGSREMSASSDLDLIIIYDFDPAHPTSDGRRQMHATQYFTRLTQRLISALTAPTRRGTLYEVDMRLRPSGSRGPLATQFKSFVDYQRTQAEVWEHMALTRARVIAGNPTLAADVAAAIGERLAQRRERRALAAAVSAMRATIAAAKGEGEPFDLKLAAGGLLDLEFIAQFLLLLHANERPELLCVGTEDILQAARRCSKIDPVMGAMLVDAHRLISGVVGLVRTIVEERFDPATAPDGVKRRIAGAVGLPDFRAVERELVETRARVRAAFNEILAPR